MLIKSSEILDDLRSASWLEQELHPETDRHRRHQMADICEADNMERIWRVLGVAVSEIRLALQPILTQPDEIKESNDLSCPDSWTFHLLFHLPESTADYIKEKAHEYLVAMVMADRTAVILPEAVGTWEKRAAEALASMRSVASTARPPHSPVRRPLWPM